MNINPLDMPALTGQPVTEAHARVCRERGHATYDGPLWPSNVCPRCGDLTDAIEVQPARLARRTLLPGEHDTLSDGDLFGVMYGVNRPLNTGRSRTEIADNTPHGLLRVIRPDLPDEDQPTHERPHESRRLVLAGKIGPWSGTRFEEVAQVDVAGGASQSQPVNRAEPDLPRARRAALSHMLTFLFHIYATHPDAGTVTLGEIADQTYRWNLIPVDPSIWRGLVLGHILPEDVPALNGQA